MFLRDIFCSILILFGCVWCWICVGFFVDRVWLLWLCSSLLGVG